MSDLETSDKSPITAPDRLLAAHAELSQNAKPGYSRNGKKIGRPSKNPGEKPPASTSNGTPTGSPGGFSLPPQTALSDVMGSGAALFFEAHAAILDDEAWLIPDSTKKELGNLLSWALADDVYKLGGWGKYLMAGIGFMGVYAVQARKTSAKRKARIAQKRADSEARARQRDEAIKKPREAPMPVEPVAPMAGAGYFVLDAREGRAQ